MAWLMLGSCVCSAACSVVPCLMARPERAWKIMVGRRKTDRYQKDMQKGYANGLPSGANEWQHVDVEGLKSEKVWKV